MTKNKTHDLTPLYAILYIVLGMVLMIWPDMSSGVICWILGAGGVLCGLYYFFGVWQSYRQGMPFQANLVLGVIFLALGIFCISSPKIVLSILPFLLGAVLLINGATKVPRCIEMKKFNFMYWWLELIFAVVTTVLGVVLIFNPFSLVRISIIFFGASVLVSGISDLVMFVWSGRSR